ncbi:MAG: hypothetical protein U1E76_08230 [Planctomycetota bacterium]
MVRLRTAGHIVGSAQISIERVGTAPSTPATSRAARPAGCAEVVKCDTLIMECTYGDPAVLAARTPCTSCACLHDLLARGRTPVVLATCWRARPSWCST